MKRYLLLVCSFIFICVSDINAQNETPADSAAKAKQQQMTQDSLQKSTTPDATKAAVQEQAKPDKVKKDTRPLKDRIRFSLSSSFWANSSYVYLEVSPLVTYYFPKKLSIGAGPTYVYNQDKRTDTDLNGWGGKVYGRYDITKWLYAWTEYQGIKSQQLNIETFYPYSSTKDYEYIDSWYLSLGVNLRLGRKTINLQALYDVLYDNDNYYTPEPWTYRVSFGF